RPPEDVRQRRGAVRREARGWRRASRPRRRDAAVRGAGGEGSGEGGAGRARARGGSAPRGKGERWCGGAGSRLARGGVPRRHGALRAFREDLSGALRTLRSFIDQHTKDLPAVDGLREVVVAATTAGASMFVEQAVVCPDKLRESSLKGSMGEVVGCVAKAAK